MLVSVSWGVYEAWGKAKASLVQQVGVQAGLALLQLLLLELLQMLLQLLLLYLLLLELVLLQLLLLELLVQARRHTLGRIA